MRKEDTFKGFEELQQELFEIIDNVEDPISILEEGAEEFVNDLLKLPKPYSKIHASGYTHLVDTFCYEKKQNEVVVGWGKYYGRILEDGSVKTKAQPHLAPVFEKNKEKYYQTMINKIFN